MKTVIIIVGVVVGLVTLPLVAYMLKFQAETGKMTPLETQEFTEDVFVVRDTFVNFFLIRSEEHYIKKLVINLSEFVTDAGMAGHCA